MDTRCAALAADAERRQIIAGYELPQNNFEETFFPDRGAWNPVHTEAELSVAVVGYPEDCRLG